ncbi:MAG: FHA domain-containing protein [Chthoniobacterales bacterium]
MTKLRISLPDGTPLVHDLGEDRVSVGRLPDNDIQIEDDSISSHHAEITFDGSNYQLTDLGSTNGTSHNGSETTGATLTIGDSIRFGQVEATVEGEAPVSGDQPLPDSGPKEVKLGSGSARPQGYSSASPFPKPAADTGPIGKVAVALAALGVLAFGAAIALSLGMVAPTV